MYFNYVTNSFLSLPQERTRKENVTEIVEISIPEDCVEVDDELCETMFNEINTSTTPKAIFANEYTHYPEVRELEIVVDPIAEIRKRIADLKRKLDETDYQAIKYAEGFISETDYAPMKALRQAYRDEINRLEAELASA